MLKIKQELSKGEENILYFKTPDLKESVNSNLRFYHIESFFYFFGNKIYLFNGGYGSDLRNEKNFSKEYWDEFYYKYSKERFVNELRKSYTYRKLINL